MPNTKQQKAIAERGAATKVCYENIIPPGTKFTVQKKSGKGLSRKLYDCVEAAVKK
jgi:hypothetical protein